MQAIAEKLEALHPQRFRRAFSNGFTDGCNNAIKTLKCVAFGFRYFSNFRARILCSVNPVYHNI